MRLAHTIVSLCGHDAVLDGELYTKESCCCGEQELQSLQILRVNQWLTLFRSAPCICPVT